MMLRKMCCVIILALLVFCLRGYIDAGSVCFAEELSKGTPTNKPVRRCTESTQSKNDDYRMASKSETIVQSGHYDKITSVVFSPDKKYVASGSADRTIKLWRISDGILLRTFEGHQDQIVDLFFSPDGLALVRFSLDAKIKIWRLIDGELLHTISTGYQSGTDYPFTHYISYSADGRLIAIAGTNPHEKMSIKVFCVSDGALVQRIDVVNSLLAIALSPDGSTIAGSYLSNGEGKAIDIWRLNDGMLSQSIKTSMAKSAGFSQLNYSPDGAFLVGSAVGSFPREKGQQPRDYELMVWRISDGMLVQSMGEKKSVRTIRSAIFSRDGKYIAEAFTPEDIHIWSVSDGVLIKKIATKEGDFYSYAFSDNGYHLAIGNSHEGVNIYSNESIVMKIVRYPAVRRLPANAILSKSGIIASATQNNVTTWRLMNGSLLRSMQSPLSKGIGAITMPSDGGDLVSSARYYIAEDGLEDKKYSIDIWNTSVGIWKKIWPGHGTPVNKIVTSPDNETIASMDREGVKLWSISTGSTIKRIDKETNRLSMPRNANGSLKIERINRSDRNEGFPKGHLKDMAFSPDGAYLAVSVSPIRWGGAVNSEQFYTLSFSSEQDYSKNSRRAPNTLSLIHVPDGRLRTFKDTKLVPENYDYASAVTSIAFNTKSKIVALGGYEIKLWRVSDGSLVQSFGESSHFAYSGVAFSPDDKFIAGGSTEGTLKIWRLADGKLMKTFGGYMPGSSIVFSHDGNHILATDAIIRIWNSSTGDYVSLFNKDVEWLMYTPDGYFDSSRRGGGLLSIIKGMSAFGPDQFALMKNRPDIILARMGLGSQELIEHYYNQYRKRLRKSGFTEDRLSSDLHVPVVKVVETKQDGKFVNVKFTMSDSKYDLKKYNIYVNEVPLFAAYGKDVSGKDLTLTERVELTNGRNKIEVAAFNEKGAESYRGLTFVEYQVKEKGNLYFIGFGVSKYNDQKYNLKYADKDVKDLANIYSRMKGRSYNDVIIKTYLNEEVTTENLKNAKEIVKTAKVDDTVVVFIAGHGVHDVDKETTYYFLGYNSKINDLSRSAISFDDIEDLLQGIAPRNRLLLIDTCESGEVDSEAQKRYFAMSDTRGIRARAFRSVEIRPKTSKSAASREIRGYLWERERYIYNDLARRTGTMVFSSSKGNEFSYESDKIQNGFFTKAVIGALTQKSADANGDGVISTEELREYVSKMVPEQTGGLQHPTVDKDNLYQKFGFDLVN